MGVEDAVECLAGGEYSDIVNQRKRPSESSSRIGPENDSLDRGVFQCQTGSKPEPFAIEPVGPQAQNRGELLPGVEGVLSAKTDGIFLGQLPAGFQRLGHYLS